MAATYTIQDITNPNLTYEERAKLRKERREKRGQSTDANIGRPPSSPFRTHSPTVQPSFAPTLGFPSEFAYVSTLGSSPRSSPTPTKKVTESSAMFCDHKKRALSEPVDLEQVPFRPMITRQPEINGIQERETKDDDDIDTGGFPKHVPTTSYDSRTPRLLRGTQVKSNIIYRRDLDDFNKQDITIVMFPRGDATLERNRDTGTNENTLSPRSSDENGPPKGAAVKIKGGLTIVPSASESTTPSSAHTVTTDQSLEDTKTNGPVKPTRKLSKTFSFLSKKDKSDNSSKKKSPKVKRKQSSSSAEKKLSSGGLSGMSMPNLYSPTSEGESDASDSSSKSGKNYSFFRRKQDKKSSVQRTSWTFQQTPESTELTPSLQPAISLQNIAESPTDLEKNETGQTGLNRTGSMEAIPQFTSELVAPVNVFSSSHSSDDEDELPISISNDTFNNRSPSPLSVGSISIDIPDLPDPGKPITPLPTLMDMTANSLKETLEKKTWRKEEETKTIDNEMEQSQGPLQSSDKDVTNESSSTEPDTMSPESDEQKKGFSRNFKSRKPLRKPSSGGKDSPASVKKLHSMRHTPDSLDQQPLSSSPTKISLGNQSTTKGDSPVTTPTNERKKVPKLPGPMKVEKRRVGSFKEKKATSTDSTTPTNSPKAIRRATPPVSKVRQSPGSSPIPPSPVASRSSKNTKSPLATPKFNRSTPATSSIKKKTSSTSPRHSPRNSPKMGRKVTNLSLKSKSVSESVTSMGPESPMTKKRRLGITSVTSPLTEEKNLSNVQSTDKPKIVPKRPAPSPPESRRKSEANIDNRGGVKTSLTSAYGDNKPASSTTTSISKRSSTSSVSSTYVYQGRLKKNSDSTPMSYQKPPNKEPQTYTYTAGSLKKKSQTNDPERSSIRNKKVSDQRKSSIPSIKTSADSGVSTPTTQRASSGTNPSKTSQLSIKTSKLQNTKSATSISTTNSNSAIKKQHKMSLVELGTPKQSPKVVKSSSEDKETTLDILKPLDSLLSSSSEDKLSKSGLSSPPPFESMLARPFSPVSPPFSSNEEGDISLTPEVPLDGEDKLTYVYRSTLLRKSSGGGNSVNQITRTASNKSIGADNTRRMSRTGSPKKISSASVGSPVRRGSISGASIRRGSTSGASFRRGSTSSFTSPTRKSLQNMSMRRPSSGVARSTLERNGITSSSTMGRPRSASQTALFQSGRKKSSLAPTSTLTRQSLKKKASADSFMSKKPPSGLQTSKKSSPATVPCNTKDNIDGSSLSTASNKKKSPVHNVSSSAETTPMPPFSKPKNIVKSYSVAEMEKKENQVRKSLKVSKSIEPISKPKLVESRSAFLKPPSGSSGTLGRKKTSTEAVGRASLRKTPSVETLSRGSTRASRRSNAGTIKKVSQSNSPLHSSTKSSPTHGTLNRKDTIDDFEYVSSMADKTKLSSASDFRRQIKPRTNYKPSPSHLQKLKQRKDVSTEMETAKPTNTDDDKGDPNAYSTYMGKKKLDQSALAGLAAKLDFSTVQLKKTGIVEQMMSNNTEGGSSRRQVIDEVHNSYGVQMTSHPLMLMTIKGRKNLQVRLVEPSATSINSGDVFILVGEQDLFLWQGKDANVLEKARANDVVNRIHQKRELGCRANGYTHLDDEEGKKDVPKKNKQFWEHLKGKPSMKKDINIVPADEVYERGVSSATKVYQFVMEGDIGKYLTVHEDSTQPLKISLLDTKKVLLFDFCSEVYVWMGKRCPPNYRKQAMIKARKHYDSGYIPPVFSNTSSPKKIMPSGARQSQRFHSKMHQRHGTLSGNSIRRKTLERKPSKSDLQERPSWSLFARVNESSETILFREKFCDWPEPGRIIKMRGHESSGEVIKAPPMPELQPADVQQMLKPRSKFEGMRLEGENIHRGHGNYKVSRSTFACNRVRSQKVEKYLVKDADNVLLPEKSNGIFYNGEGYVIRWSYIITVVRELEGLTPGEGMFARDRKYRKEKQGKSIDENKPEKKITEDDSSDEDVDDSDEESKRVLESGGRDRVTYFFWQGELASINEKGAAAVITVKMDTERAPQIRVPQGKEHPAFLQLYKGSMVILCGKSSDENNTINHCPKGYRLYAVLGNAKKEACLIEIDVKNHPIYYYTRSRGCYVIQHSASSTVYLWNGCKATDTLKGVAAVSARKLKRRLNSFKLIKVNEGAEPKELNNLMGSRTLYHSLLTVNRPMEYSPRLFNLSSSTGWFLATEELHVSMPDSIDTPDSFPFLQEDLYNATQPGLFVLDIGFEIYLWMGWWPVQQNKLLREKNAFSGLAQSRWAKDKKLAIETVMAYAEASKRDPKPVIYVVNAGTEHVEFTNQFPIWNERKDVQEIVGSSKPNRVLAEKEFAKYNKKTYTLEELLKRPEEVDPASLETYLSDQDFKKIFKVTKEEFSKLSGWKQKGLKQNVGLF